MSDGFKQVSVKLEPDLREALQRAADQDQRPLAGLIRKILRDHASRSRPRPRSRAHGGGQAEAVA